MKKPFAALAAFLTAALPAQAQTAPGTVPIQRNNLNFTGIFGQYPDVKGMYVNIVCKDNRLYSISANSINDGLYADMYRNNPIGTQHDAADNVTVYRFYRDAAGNHTPIQTPGDMRNLVTQIENGTASLARDGIVDEAQIRGIAARLCAPMVSINKKTAGINPAA